MDDTKIIVTVMLLIVLGGAVYFGSQWWREGGSTLIQQIARVESTEVFSCAEGKSITAALGERQVTVSLSDGRAFTLEQKESASGVRYANEGDAVVFFTQADDAFLEEGGIKTYADCVQTTVTENTGPEETPDQNALMAGSPAASSLDKATNIFVGKWRNAESQNQLFKIRIDGGLQESYVSQNGQFMVPEARWRLEKTPGASDTFDLTSPKGALNFVRVSEKGDERRYQVISITEDRIELKELPDGGSLNLVRIPENPQGESAQ